jgi:hypothetical protein
MRTDDGNCCPTEDSCCDSKKEISECGCCGGKSDISPDKMAAHDKRLEIEWKHFAVGDATCERCGNTGEALNIAVKELRQELMHDGVTINLSETLLDKTRIAESNEIRMNGVLLEDLLAATAVSTDCPSCSTLAGESTCCRATEIGGNRYEDVPVWAIKKAAYAALEIEIQ